MTFADKTISHLFLSASLCSVLATSGAYAEDISIDEAISRTINQHSEVEIKKSEVRGARADVQASEGDFDIGLSGSVGGSKTDEAVISTTTGVESEKTTRSQSYEMGLSKKFESSVEVALSNTIATSRLAHSPARTIGTSDWSLSITLPLLQGGGYDAVTSTKRAAQSTFEATRYASGHDISEQAYAAIIAYWSSLEAKENFTNLQITMQRASDTANTLEERQLGGELAGVEYQRSLAELRLREVDLESGRQAKYESQESLALAMGNREDQELPEVVGTFPLPADMATLDKLDANKLLSLALLRRLDIKAQEKLIEAAQISLNKSKDDTLPSLDLGMSGGYTSAIPGFDSGKTSNLYEHKERNGPDYSMSLTLSYPLGNNAANGAMYGEMENLNQKEITLIQLKRSIRNEINVTIDKLKSAVRSYELSAQSLALMEEVAIETKRKLNFGEASMTDMISVEDRLTEGRLSMIKAQSDYAQALAELRFVTGTMTTDKDENLIINAEQIQSLPLAELSTVDG